MERISKPVTVLTCLLLRFLLVAVITLCLLLDPLPATTGPVSSQPPGSHFSAMLTSERTFLVTMVTISLLPAATASACSQSTGGVVSSLFKSGSGRRFLVTLVTIGLLLPSATGTALVQPLGDQSNNSSALTSGPGRIILVTMAATSLILPSATAAALTRPFGGNCSSMLPSGRNCLITMVTVASLLKSATVIALSQPSGGDSSSAIPFGRMFLVTVLTATGLLSSVSARSHLSLLLSGIIILATMVTASQPASASTRPLGRGDCSTSILLVTMVTATSLLLLLPPVTASASSASASTRPLGRSDCCYSILLVTMVTATSLLLLPPATASLSSASASTRPLGRSDCYFSILLVTIVTGTSLLLLLPPASAASASASASTRPLCRGGSSSILLVSMVTATSLLLLTPAAAASLSSASVSTRPQGRGGSSSSILLVSTVTATSLLVLLPPASASTSATTYARYQDLGEDCANNPVLKVAVLAPFGGANPMGREISEKTAQFTFQLLNKNCHVTGLNFTYKLRNTDCDVGQGLFEVVDVGLGYADGFVGPMCDSVCQPAGLLTGMWGEPMVSFGCETTILSNRTLYPLFASTTTTYRQMGHFLSHVLEHFGFKQDVMLVTLIEAADLWLEVAVELANDISESTKKLHWAASLRNLNLFEKKLTQNTVTGYVFVLCMFPEDVLNFLYHVKRLGFFREGVAFITLNYANLGVRLGMNATEEYDFTGLLDITIDVNHASAEFKSFTEHIVDPSRLGHEGCFHYEEATHAALMSDAIRLLAEVMKKSWSNGKLSHTSLATHLTDTTFKGVSGQVVINEQGTRSSNMLLSNLYRGCYMAVGKSRPEEHSKDTVGVLYQSLSDDVVWPGGTRSTPRCPSTLCTDDDISASWIAVIIVVTAATVVLTTVVYLIVRRRKMLYEMGRKDWILTPEQLYSTVPNSSMIPKSLGGSRKARSNHDLEYNGLDTSGSRSRMSRDSKGTIVHGQLYTKVAFVDQHAVAVKLVNKTSIVLTNDVIKEINLVRQLKHANVNTLMGACLDPENVSLVWLYCGKGSVSDVLCHEFIRLDWMFKLSFIMDIAKGMAYLHQSPVGVHGRLKSTNVVIDNNWCCKITDIYMPCFRAGEGSKSDNEWSSYYDLLWTAPELLRLPNRSRGTKKGDVYSFAIIMHEIITRGKPFGVTDDDNPRAIVDRVTAEENPPLRPLLPEEEEEDRKERKGGEGVVDLMVMCWDEYPLFRLSFPTISHNLKKIRQSYGAAGNLVDQMLEMVTKYADNLENLVEERTQQLAEEQKKTEELLARMLPKSVAYSLKMGNPVEPESYQSVTIFFSDIVGFTSLASVSTPMQVVTLLNDLYTNFDTCVDKHDAYKMETIGDAYMIVSGLPDRNGNRHSGEIACTALDILTRVLGFRIRHCPDRQLLLRIGLHTGPAVAGVVGLTMPRYCLFGDTVNYASRMESTGLALHIHVSPECKEHLDKLSGYQLTLRGETELKGLGSIKTYFLRGKDGYRVDCSVELRPEIRDLVGIDVNTNDGLIHKYVSSDASAKNIPQASQKLSS